MPAEVTIHYDSGNYLHGEAHAFDLWTGGSALASQPLPLVSLSNDSIHYGYRWGTSQSITLNGQITGETFKDLILYQSALRDKFSRSFKKFSIKEGDSQIFGPDNMHVEAGTLYTRPYCKVENISFSQSNYVGMVDYSISLFDFNDVQWSGDGGTNSLDVTDPKDSWSFSDSEDGTATVSHNISAKGRHTPGRSSDNQDPITNAKDWVNLHTGSSSMPQPYFVGGGKTAYPILLTVSENINRTDGTYSIDESYAYNTGESLQPIVNHNLSVDSGVESDFVTVSYDVTLKGGKNLSLDDMRGTSAYNRYITNDRVYIIGETNVSDINSIPTTYSVNENTGSNSIQYQATYDNNDLFENSFNNAGADAALANAYWDYTVDLAIDELKGFTTVTVQGPVVARGNDLSEKLIRSERFAKAIEENGFAYDVASGVYEDFLPLEKRFSLSPVPKSLSVSKNVFTSEFTVTASFDDKFVFLNGDYPRRSSYNVSINPSIRVFKPKPACNQNGYYVVYDTDVEKRETLGVTLEIDYNGNMAKADASFIIDNMHQNIVDQYCSALPKYVTSESQNTNDQMKTIVYTQQLNQPKTNIGLGNHNPILRYNYYFY